MDAPVSPWQRVRAAMGADVHCSRRVRLVGYGQRRQILAATAAGTPRQPNHDLISLAPSGQTIDPAAVVAAACRIAVIRYGSRLLDRIHQDRAALGMMAFDLAAAMPRAILAGHLRSRRLRLGLLVANPLRLGPYSLTERQGRYPLRKRSLR